MKDKAVASGDPCSIRKHSQTAFETVSTEFSRHSGKPVTCLSLRIWELGMSSGAQRLKILAEIQVKEFYQIQLSLAPNFN